MSFDELCLLFVKSGHFFFQLQGTFPFKPHDEDVIGDFTNGVDDVEGLGLEMFESI